MKMFYTLCKCLERLGIIEKAFLLLLPIVIKRNFFSSNIKYLLPPLIVLEQYF